MITSTHLALKFPFSLYETVMSHGWVMLSPWKWDPIERELSRQDRLRSDKFVTIKVSQIGPRSLNLQIRGQQLISGEVEDAQMMVCRWLSLDWDPGPAIRVANQQDSNIGLYIKQGGGRFLRCTTFFEDLVKTVCTINTNWKSTIRMTRLLVDEVGNGVFPRPIEVLDVGVAVLSKCLRLGFRSRTIDMLSHRLLTDGIVDNWGCLNEQKLSYEYLLNLEGIGPYSAGHTMMLSNNFAYLPIDSEVINYCRRNLNLKASDIDSHYSAWGVYRTLGYKLTRRLYD